LFQIGKNPGFPNMPCPEGKAVDKSGFAAAIAAAKAADVAVLFLGSDQTTEAENYDRKEIGLAGVQEELLAAVVAANPKTVLVLINGGPLAIESAKETVPAM
jgi:beta-glucosidase